MNLLFDLDGTLADPMDAFSGSLDFAFDQLQVPRLSHELMRTLIGPPLHLALPSLLGEKNALAPEALRLFREHHSSIGLYQYRFYPGMEKAMRHLIGKNHRLFVATSKPKIYADRLLEHFGMKKYFEEVYGSELSGKNSKKGDVIKLALDEKSLAPGKTLMLGDRKHDVIGAQENGLSAIGVSWGYGSREELSSAGASSIVGDWDELLAYLTEGFSCSDTTVGSPR